MIELLAAFAMFVGLNDHAFNLSPTEAFFRPLF